MRDEGGGGGGGRGRLRGRPRWREREEEGESRGRDGEPLVRQCMANDADDDFGLRGERESVERERRRGESAIDHVAVIGLSRRTSFKVAARARARGMA